MILPRTLSEMKNLRTLVDISLSKTCSRHLSSQQSKLIRSENTNLNQDKQPSPKPLPAKTINYALQCEKGAEVTLHGWVKSLRKQKKFVFFDVYDGLSHKQFPVVLPSDNKPEDLNMHASVEVTGVLAECPNNPAIMELHPTSDVKVLGPCDQSSFPFAGKTKYTSDALRRHLHLRPKTKRFASLLRLRNSIKKSIHEFFDSNEFIYIDTPILTSNDCEGAGETFLVRPESEALINQMIRESKDAGKSKAEIYQNPPSKEEVFFNNKVRLTVSSQLHLESVVSGIQRVYTISPVFRAENQKSTRHLSEFYMVEAEVAFAQELHNLLDIIESLVKFTTANILAKSSEELVLQLEDNVGRIEVLNKLCDQQFAILTFEEASEVLSRKYASNVPSNTGLSREQELILTEKYNNSLPVFVVNWPSEIKPFYMRQTTDDSSKVAAVDLLVPLVGELCGGSLRENSVDILDGRIRKLDPTLELLNSLEWYLDLRRYGGVPSGGFGLGFDRFVQFVSGIDNIKNVSPFPRWAHNCSL